MSFASAHLEARAIADLSLQACRGLAHINDHGIIHGDLSPGNILVHNGVVKVSRGWRDRAAPEAGGGLERPPLTWHRWLGSTHAPSDLPPLFLHPPACPFSSVTLEWRST